MAFNDEQEKRHKYTGDQRPQIVYVKFIKYYV